jgi:hypothetical protein
MGLFWGWRVVLTFKKEQVTVPKACNEVFRTFYSSLDNTSIVLQAALLPVLEEQMAGHPLDATTLKETLAVTRRIRWLTTSLTRMSTAAETHHELLSRIERPFTRTPERTDQQLWPLFLKNQANLDAFSVGHPSERYLDTRKIFLPQGATLILLHWQSELDELVTEIEEVSCSSGVWTETGCC